MIAVLAYSKGKTYWNNFIIISLLSLLDQYCQRIPEHDMRFSIPPVFKPSLVSAGLSVIIAINSNRITLSNRDGNAIF